MVKNDILDYIYSGLSEADSAYSDSLNELFGTWVKF